MDQDPTERTTVRRGGGRRPERPLRRSADNRYVGGVCGGLARRFGVSSRSVRVLMAVLAVVAGFGLALYAILWVLIERDGETSSIAARILEDRRELEIVVAVGTVVLALLVAMEAVGLPGFGSIAWPLGAFAVAGLAVWRGASDDERLDLQELLGRLPVNGLASSKSRSAIALRAGAGIALVLIGIAVLSGAGQGPNAAAGALIGAGVLLAGFLVLFAPWWLHTLRALTDERRERVRAQERADVAAHVHDSVLQSLTLIQRAAHDPAEVVRLARLQERELRGWLFNPKTIGTRNGLTPTTIAEAAADIEREVEDTYGTSLDLVVVGDGPIDDDVAAVLAAGREAAINAAKWSGAPVISVFVEVEDAAVSMYVRDVGVGFDTAQVPADRQGITQSIVERMVRHGGTAVIRTTPGHGTEVELRLARSDAQP